MLVPSVRPYSMLMDLDCQENFGLFLQQIDTPGFNDS